MKRIVALLLVLLPSSLTAADFRGSDWGDTVEEVRAAETATFHHRGEGELAFVDSSIEGVRGGILYLFEEDVLVRGVYVSRDDYPGGEGALEDYQRLTDYLNDLMGHEGEEELRWTDETLRGQPERLSEAIVQGHVRVTRRWVRENTHVDLLMTGRQGGVYLRALFQPRI